MFGLVQKNLGKLLGMRHINGSLKKYPEADKRLYLEDTKGGKQQMLYISLNGLKQLLLKSRKYEHISKQQHDVDRENKTSYT